MGKYAQGIMGIMSAYADGPGRVTALEILLKSAEENGRRAAINEVAANACEGLHIGPPQGVKCRSCYEAEGLMDEIASVEADIEMARKGEEDGDAADAD